MTTNRTMMSTLLSVISIAFLQLGLVTTNPIEFGGKNFTATYDEIPGKCPDVEPYLISENKTLYEGRWFFTQIGLKKDQVKNLSCATWDSFFDKTGALHNILDIFENNVHKTMYVDWKPVTGKDGNYISKVNDNITLKATTFYMDTEVFIFVYVVCFNDKDFHYRDVVIGYRRLEFEKDKKQQVRRIRQVLGKKGGDAKNYFIKQDTNCNYIPIRRSDSFK